MSRLPFKIGELLIDPPVLSAPMAGFTNYAYRRLLRELGGAGLIATEMVSARSFSILDSRGMDHPARLWGVESEPRPLAVQIWDNIPETLAETAHRLAHDYKVSLIDLNFGCPAPKIVSKSSSGSYLLKDPEKVGNLVAKVREAAAPVPVTAKIRLGLTADTINAIDVAQAVEGGGGAALTVHGRTTRQMYSGLADWDEIGRIKPFLQRIPLIGNGDIKTVEQALDRLDHWPVDGIMIGRGGFDHPWLFRQIQQALNGSPIYPDPTVEEQKELLLRLYHLVCERFGQEKTVVMMRRYACHFSKSKPGGRSFRARIGLVQTEEEFFSILKEF